jgi:NTE family protein
MADKQRRSDTRARGTAGDPNAGPSRERVADEGRPKIGLALAGGGPQGAVYEIGALLALEEAVEGVDWNDLHVYVGLSAGAFVGSCLANQIPLRGMCEALVAADGRHAPFNPRMFFTPAVEEFFQRVGMLPRLFAESVWYYVTHPTDLTLPEALLRMSRGLPVGAFASEPIHLYLEKLFSRQGRTNDFRSLDHHLVVVAADLDSGRAVRFGEPGWDHVPISRAVQASAALPGIYTPVEIEGRSYVDGVLIKTLHASVALDAGAELVFCINPLVPIDTARAVEAGIMERGKLKDRGLPSVLAQTLRTMIRSRLQTGLDAYATRYQGADVLLFEPRHDDYRMFFTNIFSFSQRRAVCEHAYRRTRRNLLARREELEPILERHGLGLQIDVLEDRSRNLWGPVDTAAVRRAARRRRRRLPTAGGTVERFDQALDRLERYLDGESLDRTDARSDDDSPEGHRRRFRVIEAS